MPRELLLPPDFEDYAWEVEAKGVFWDATVNVDGVMVDVTFYDLARLTQDVGEDLADDRPFAAKRLLVVEKLTVGNMQSAAAAAPPAFFE